MQAFFLSLAILAFQQVNAGALPVVEQDVELISIAHMPDQQLLVFFWADIQGDHACLAHRWCQTTMRITADGDSWRLEWEDSEDHCYRIVRAPIWVESWEWDDPREGNKVKKQQWHNLLEPGLKQPPKAEAAQ